MNAASWTQATEAKLTCHNRDGHSGSKYPCCFFRSVGSTSVISNAIVFSCGDDSRPNSASVVDHAPSGKHNLTLTCNYRSCANISSSTYRHGSAQNAKALETRADAVPDYRCCSTSLTTSFCNWIWSGCSTNSSSPVNYASTYATAKGDKFSATYHRVLSDGVPSD